MMVSDTQKTYHGYMRHHYKKIILLFLIVLLLFITYDTIAVDKNKDTLHTISGNIVFRESPSYRLISIEIIVDSGEIVDKMDTNEDGFFSFTLKDNIEGKAYFLVWINGESYRGEDEYGNIRYFDISRNTNQDIIIYVDNPVQPLQDDDPIENIDESDVSDDTVEEPSEEINPTEDDSADSSNTSDDSNQQQENTNSTSDDQQDEDDDSSTNTTDNTGQSDNSTSDDQNNTTSNPPQNTTNPPVRRTVHNISLSKTIWIEETQSWETQCYLEINEEVNYNISIYNNDTANLSNITIVDYLPDGIIFIEDNTTENESNYHQYYDPLNHTITWNITKMTTNQTVFLNYRCIINSSGKHTNKVILNATGNGDLTYEVNASADLFVFGYIFVEKTIWDPHSMTWTDHLITSEDSHLHMNITIIYQGGFHLDNITCIDTFSDDMVFLGNVTLNGVSTIVFYNATMHQFIWNTSRLEQNESVYLEFDVKIVNKSIHVNTVKVIGDESIGRLLTNSAEVYVESVPEDQVYINKKVGYSLDALDESLNVTINDTILFSIDIRNIGNATIFNMTLRDYLPSSMVYVEDSAIFLFKNKSFMENPNIDNITNMLTWKRIQTIIEDHIGPYEQCTLSFQVTVHSLGTYINTVNFSYGRYHGETTFETFSMDNASIQVADRIQPLNIHINGPDEILVNTSMEFLAIVSGGLSPYSYFWDFDDGTNSTNSSPVHEYTIPGWYTILLQVTDNNNTTASSTHLIRVIPKDVNPPVITLSDPSRSIYVKGRKVIPFFTTIVFGTIEIQGTVIDNESDIEYIKVYIDNSEVAIFYHSQFSYSWQKRLFGRHEIKIIAIDTQGNLDMVKTIVWKFF